MKSGCAVLALVGSLAVPGRVAADEARRGSAAPMASGGPDWPEAPLPSGEGERPARRAKYRSPTMAIVGGALLGAGLITGAAGAIALATYDDRSRGAPDFTGLFIGVIPMVAGALQVLVGVPLLAVGLSSPRDPPARTGRSWFVPSLQLGPASAHLRVVF